ncbi:MAG: hypothetical protein U5R31_13285 [Acidimicrobiia bacterium]|nr:hypothetical protein [Acidimicrobiia bacterium]
MILDLRDDYRDSPHYKKIYDKQSFDNWDKVITILSDWGIASDRALDAFRKLKDRRNAAIHFDPAVDENSAERLACDAVRALQEAVESQFGIFNQPWQIPDAPHTYVAVEAESWPFVKRIVIPSPSVELVGPEAASGVRSWYAFIHRCGDWGRRSGRR